MTNSLLKKILITSSLSLALATTSFAGDSKKVIAKYDNGEITAGQIEDQLKSLFNGQLPENKKSFSDFDKDTQEKLARGFAAEQMLDKVIKDANFIDTDKDFQEKKAKLLKELARNEYLLKKANAEVTEAKVKEAYNNFVKEWGTDRQEISASHILVKTEEEAKNIINKLKKGEKFDVLAKEHSLDLNNKDKGGELGNFITGTMVPEFEKATLELKDGEYSKTPIKTPYGYHIIKLKSRKKALPPKFEEMQAKFKNELVSKYINDYVKNLTEKEHLQLMID